MISVSDVGGNKGERDGGSEATVVDLVYGRVNLEGGEGDSEIWVEEQKVRRGKDKFKWLSGRRVCIWVRVGYYQMGGLRR